MDDKKIAFISCINDTKKYNKMLKYINDLYVPEGYKIEILKVVNAESIFAGYNKGMRNTDAKYKVYLHQDVYIENEKFLSDIIRIFNQDSRIGLMGVIGAYQLPGTGIWWEAEIKYGEVYDSHTGKMGLIRFQQPEQDYQIVEAVDGLIMATQYDCLWREDVFGGWHFYDISQCMEFKEKGYQVVVPKQKKPWCTHDSGVASTEGYEKNRKIFLNEYFKE